MTFCASEVKCVDVCMYFQSEHNFITLYIQLSQWIRSENLNCRGKGAGEAHCRIGCKYVWIQSFNDLNIIKAISAVFLRHKPIALQECL